MRRNLNVAVFTALTMGLASCSSLPTDPVARTEVLRLNDPFEPANRQIYEFNRAFRETVVGPLADAYNSPGFSTVSVPLSNVLQNLRAPMVFANDLAQGRPCAAGVTLQRFLINSTVGVAGTFDVADSKANLKGHENSVAQTFASWGVPEGSYLMLPVLGPSNVRGLAGLGVEYFFDPVDRVLSSTGIPRINKARTGLELFDAQAGAAADLARLERSSLDGYAALRSAARQNEARQFGEPPTCPLPMSTPAWTTDVFSTGQR
ncbi:MAG: VacJ family lipoprotein [Hyphomicrobiaceae bacterium]